MFESSSFGDVISTLSIFWFEFSFSVLFSPMYPTLIALIAYFSPESFKAAEDILRAGYFSSNVTFSNCCSEIISPGSNWSNVPGTIFLLLLPAVAMFMLLALLLALAMLMFATLLLLLLSLLLLLLLLLLTLLAVLMAPLTTAMAKLMKAKEDMPGAWLSQSSGAGTDSIKT